MADAPLMVVDAAGLVTGWSREAERRFGVATADVMGMRVMDVLALDSLRPPPEAEGLTAEALRLEPLGATDWALRSAGEGGDSDAVLDAVLLEVLFTQVRVHTYVLDPHMRVLRVSDSSGDRDADENTRLRGQAFRDVCPFRDPEAVEAALAELIRTGVPVMDQEYEARPHAFAGGRHSFEITAFRLRTGRTTHQEGMNPDLGVLVFTRDVTEQTRSRDRGRALDAVRGTVGRTLDIEATCRDLVDALVPDYVDVGAVEVVDTVLRGDAQPPGPLGRGVPLHRAAYGGSNVPAHPIGDVRAVPYGTPFQRTLTDLRTRVVPLDGATWLDSDPARARSIRQVGAHTLLLAPITLRGSVLGLLTLYRCGDSDPFTEEDIPVVEAMASRVALGIDNARRYIHEYTLASALQRRLMPQRTVPQPAVETDNLVLPGVGPAVWFDTIALSGARTALVIGEVHERGIQGATAMGQLRTVVHALAALDLEPDELLARVYDTAARLAEERMELPESDPLHREPLEGSCTYAVYDPFAGTCTLASAGHTAPLVVEADGCVKVIEVIAGPLLGTMEREPVAAVSFPLAEGSLVALHTSAVDRYAVPGEAMSQALSAPERSLQEICDAIAYALPDTPELRGAAVLLARARAMPPDRYATWELPYDKTAPATARRLTSKTLADWHVGADTGEATELIVSELVTNAVRYGSPPVELRLILDRGLTCEIRDSSSTAPYMKYAGAVDEGGRGLFIISQLASLWGTRFASEGKIVWSEQTIAHGEGPVDETAEGGDGERQGEGDGEGATEGEDRPGGQGSTG
ncbi:SpoIIE family protein phosphatase [Streptomyces sp. NPDC059166]|uniref:SpoIIE family protein phosphatase n=1 Tax=Streptomyces sp. NPDC059166 TaxID=3346752 RepID=UPI003683D5C7